VAGPCYGDLPRFQYLNCRAGRQLATSKATEIPGRLDQSEPPGAAGIEYGPAHSVRLHPGGGWRGLRHDRAMVNSLQPSGRGPPSAVSENRRRAPTAHLGVHPSGGENPFCWGCMHPDWPSPETRITAPSCWLFEHRSEGKTKALQQRAASLAPVAMSDTRKPG